MDYRIYRQAALRQGAPLERCAYPMPDGRRCRAKGYYAAGFPGIDGVICAAHIAAIR